MTATFQPTAATTSVAAWLSEFGTALAAADGDAAAALFTQDGFWRDLIAFT